MKIRKSGFWKAVICAGWVLFLIQPVFAERTLNHGLHAVPAPAVVKIDGDLSEWDTSGAIILCKDTSTMLDTESGKVSAMWDQNNLYVAIEWRDTTPMQNKVDPVTLFGSGWRSDCVQLRCNMNNFVVHVDAWYYTPEKRPAMNVTYGRLDVADGGQPKVDRPSPEKMGAQGFHVSADGHGYVQEIKLPWAMLTLDGKIPPKTADLRLGIELFWGDAAAQGWPKSRVTDNLMDGETQTDFFWTNTKAWGRLILEDKNNLQLPVPSWLRAKAAPVQGPVKIDFTVPQDSYVTVAIEDEKGNRVKSLVGGAKFPKGSNTVYWSGLDDRNQALQPGKYRWLGIYRDQLDVKWKMSFYQPNTRCPWGNVKGTGAWGPDHGTLLAAAAANGKVYFGGFGAEAGFPLLAVDEKTGEKIWSCRSDEPDHLACVDRILYACTTNSGDKINWLSITPRGLMQFDADTGNWLNINTPDGKQTRRLDLLDAKETALGFTADKDGLYLSVKEKGVIRSFNRSTFAVQKDYPLPDAGEIFAENNGKLLAVTPSAVFELTLGTGETRSLVTGDFHGTSALTADANKIYIAIGEPRHQVIVLERKGSKAKQTAVIGAKGGRTTNGWYKPEEGFINPCGLTVDSLGQLWVVERSYKPKRVSVWKDGKWISDFIGDTFYGGGGVINPLDPTTAFYKDMQFKIDIDKGTWTLRQIGLVMPKNASDYGIVYPADRPENFTGYIHVCKGKAYLINDKPRQIFKERKDGRWILCMHMDQTNKIAWTDMNDDGIVQENEIVRGAKTDNWGGMDYWGQRPSQNLDMFFANGEHGLCLRCKGVTAGGTPIYDFTKFETMAGECQNGIGLRDGSYNSGCEGERGEYYSEMRKIYPGGSRRTFWFRGENTGRWTYRLPEPGIVLYPFQTHGIVDVPSINGEVVCWVSDFGQRYLFTDDMLYVGQLFTDARGNWDDWPMDPKPGFVANSMAPGQESFMGYFCKLNDGRYILTSGFTDCRIFEVTGLDSLKRFQDGEITLTAEDCLRAKAIRDLQVAAEKGQATAEIVAISKPPAVDGDPSAWTQGKPVEITVDEQRNARVYTSYDEKNLYVAWDVKDNSPMINQAKRWELAFKGGDAVDLMFRVPADKPEDPAIHPGDLRLLITMFEGKSIAVLYRQISNAKAPYTFDAFEGAGRPNAVKMDEVRLASEVVSGIVKREDGYLVKAIIPLAFLDVRPKSGTQTRMDFGVLFGGPGGGQTMIRAYWSNKNTNIVVDIPSEAKLEPGNWGIVEF